MNKNIFKAYDIRGLYPSDVSVDTARTIGHALAEMFPSGKFLIAYDTRHGSLELGEVLEKSIKEKNPNLLIENIGLSTTPMFYFFVNELKAVGGAMVTASHNPRDYNGFKIVKENAVMISGTDILNYIETHGLL